MQKFSLAKPLAYVSEGRPWYDVKEGITDKIGTLQGLNEVLHERHVAGYEREEELNEFYLLGNLYLDSCGNCGKASKRITSEKPAVMTREEFWSQKQGDEGESFSMSGGDIPLPGLTCAVCGKEWGVEDCLDTVVRHEIKTISLAEFVGKTLYDVQSAYSERTDAVYRMQSDILVRNDRFIDLSPKYPNPEHDWEKNIVKNERGWLSVKDGIDGDYVIQEGDEGHFNVWAYFHEKCNRQDRNDRMEERFKEVFLAAGFKDPIMLRTPNEYCSCDCCACWFNVNTEFGTIKIGWRKRVINIDWTAAIETALARGVDGKRLNLVSLFKKEDVTKASMYIHAWGWEKAQEYLFKICDRLRKVTPKGYLVE